MEADLRTMHERLYDFEVACAGVRQEIRRQLKGGVVTISEDVVQAIRYEIGAFERLMEGRS